MTNDVDPVLRMLGQLRFVEPDSEWESRVQKRCQERLRKGSKRTNRRQRAATLVLRWTAASALCAYFVAVSVEAAKLVGALSR